MNPPPEGYLGREEVLALQAEGWGFADGGTKVGHGYAVWACRDHGKPGEKWKIFWLADPDEFPDAWAEAPPKTEPQLEMSL